MRFGADIAQQQNANRHQAFAEDLAQKNYELEATKSMYQMSEYLDKKAIQARVQEGNAALAGVLSSITDWTSPEVPRAIFKIGSKYPDLASTAPYQGALKMHETAVAQKNGLDKLTETLNSREFIETQRQKQRADEFSQKRKEVQDRLDIMATQGFDRNDIARQKLELQKADKETDYYIKSERLNQIYEDQRRLDARLKLDLEKHADSLTRMRPEDRDKYHAEMKALQLQYEKGVYLPKGADPYTPTPEQEKAAADAYNAERRRVDEKYGTSRTYYPIPTATPTTPTAPAAPAPTPAPVAPPAKKLSAEEVTRLKAEAEAAIKAGAPKEAVMKRLKELGVE